MDKKFTHIGEDEMREIKNALEHQGLAAAVQKVKDYQQQLDHVELKIAVTGESGAGKSTFVNALRGLKDDDEGAAPTGEVETTMEPTMYPHPKFPTVKVWDLPGIGSSNFKADEYLEKVHFQRYDFFIIIISERVKENDIRLATEIRRVKKSFYFVRSKIDNDIRAAKTKKGFNRKKMFERIRENCIKELQAKGVKSPMVFLISSFHLQRYDFSKLEETIEEELPQHKRHVLLLALPNITLEINQRKKMVLQENIWPLALLSASVAAVPIPGMSIAVDVAILVKEITRYYETFGLDDKSLRKLSAQTNVPLAELKAAIKSPLNKEISVDMVIKLLTRLTAASLMLAEEFLNLIPIIGSIVGAGMSFATTYLLLKSCLNELAEDGHNVLKRALQPEL